MKQLDNYYKAKEELFSAFEYKHSIDLYTVESFTDAYWAWDGDSLVWSEIMGLPEDPLYGFNASDSYVWFYGDYTMLLVDDDNGGDSFLAIFDNNKRENYNNEL